MQVLEKFISAQNDESWPAVEIVVPSTKYVFRLSDGSTYTADDYDEYGIINKGYVLKIGKDTLEIPRHAVISIEQIKTFEKRTVDTKPQFFTNVATYLAAAIMLISYAGGLQDPHIIVNAIPWIIGIIFAGYALDCVYRFIVYLWREKGR